MIELTSRLRSNKWILIVVVSIGLVVLATTIAHHLYALKYNTVNVDEPWSSSIVLSEFTLPEGAKYKMFEDETRWNSKSLSYYSSLRIPYSFFGFDPLPVRLVSLVYGYLTILAVFLIVSIMYGRLEGVIAAVFLFSFRPFTTLIQHGRIDSPAVFFMTLSILVFFWIYKNPERDKHAYLLPITGYLALSNHPNTLLIIPVLLVSAVILLDKLRWRSILPSLTIGMVVASLLMSWRFGIEYISDYSSASDVIGMPILLGMDGIVESMKIKVGILNWLISGPRQLYFNAVFVLAALAATLLDDRNRAFLVVFLIGLILFNVLVNYHTTTNTALYAMPFLGIGIGGFVNLCLRKNLQLPVKAIAFLVFLGLLQQSYLGVKGALTYVESEGRTPYEITTGEIRGLIPAGSKIMAQPTWFFALDDYPFVSDRFITYVIQQDDETLDRKYGTSFADIVRSTGTQYFILDLQMKARMDSLRLRDSRSSLPHDQFYEFLERHAVLVAKFTDTVYPEYATANDTSLEVYKVQW